MDFYKQIVTDKQETIERLHALEGIDSGIKIYWSRSEGLTGAKVYYSEWTTVGTLQQIDELIPYPEILINQTTQTGYKL